MVNLNSPVETNDFVKALVAQGKYQSEEAAVVDGISVSVVGGSLAVRPFLSRRLINAHGSKVWSNVHNAATWMFASNYGKEASHG